jgi:hypothetical protein
MPLSLFHPILLKVWITVDYDLENKGQGYSYWNETFKVLSKWRNKPASVVVQETEGLIDLCLSELSS